MTILDKGHQLSYRLVARDEVDSTQPVYAVNVQATPEEIESFARDGYLARRGLFGSSELERLRSALADVAQIETGKPLAEHAAGDLFLRHLMDKHPAFLDLLTFEPILSVARAMLGPQVQVLPVSARIAFPSDRPQFTTWHIHQRLIPEPLPPFFSRPHVIDCLIYLDNADEANGPLCVVPGTHWRIHDEYPAACDGDLPGQVMLELEAGDVVMLHGGLWHRAMPTKPGAQIRRLLILPYCAAWLRGNARPADGLTAAYVADPACDDRARELLQGATI